MLVLIEYKAASCTGSFVASYIANYYINRLGFTSVLTFTSLPETQRIFSAW